MLQTQIVRLFLRFSLFWCICCSFLPEAELKAATGKIVQKYEDWNNNTQSEVGLEFYINTLKITLVRLETGILRLKDKINREQAENKQLKTKLIDLQIKYCADKKDLEECKRSKNNVTTRIFVKGLREQMMEDIKLGNWSGSVKLMKRYLNHSILAYHQLNSFTVYNMFPIKATARGYIELMQVMLDNDLPINNGYTKHNYSLLHDAVLLKNYNLVELLIQRGADVNVRDKFGCTPLHWAAMSCNVSIVQLLVENGADINATDNSKEKETPLNSADRHNCTSVRQWLIPKGTGITLRHNIDSETADDVDATENNNKIIQKFSALCIKYHL